jgi:hypothetical protein
MTSIGEIKREEEDNKKYAKVETVCLNCVFAEWEPIDESGEWGCQSGCAFNIIPRMLEQGAEVLSREDEEKKLQYCSIVDRVCVYCRPIEGWGNRFPGIANADLMKIAREEVKPRMGMIIISDGDMDKLHKTVNSVVAMDIKPHKVCVQFKNQDMRPTNALSILGSYFDTHNIEYRIDYIMEKDAVDTRIIDIAFKKIPQSYFCTFTAGFEIPADFIEVIDKALNDDLERFLMLLPIDGINGMVAQTRVAKQIGGSNEDFLGSKLQRVAEKQECQFLIRPVTEIVKSMNSQS